MKKEAVGFATLFLILKRWSGKDILEAVQKCKFREIMLRIVAYTVTQYLGGGVGRLGVQGHPVLYET